MKWISAPVVLCDYKIPIKFLLIKKKKKKDTY
jgi:hypothetical protein